jgi:ATP-dependent Clp protease ATP-binding subunit ClpA
VGDGHGGARERDGEPLVQLGHDKVGTEHLLLGLIREGEGVAAQVLVELGADLFTVRQRVSTS